ncbi:MATE family efflux transporter [Pseudomonas palleroniana]|uniref:MATE family efflux transporter n=1 Tax=Pseudomonas palleroniana TaxID=191390 RepID=UPI003AFF7295
MPRGYFEFEVNLFSTRSTLSYAYGKRLELLTLKSAQVSNMNRRSIAITPDNVVAAYWRYALPTVMAMLVSGLYQIVDGIFIGHVVGAEGLAAINMAWPWIGLMAGVGLMIGAGAGTHCSIAQGEGHFQRAKGFLIQGLWLLALLGVVVGLLIITGRDSLLALQGGNASVQRHGTSYLQIIGWSSPLVMASIAMPILVRNLGAPMLATIMMLVGAVTNIVLDYVFIVELGWGLLGAAIATVAGESLSALIGLVFLFTRYSSLPLSVALGEFGLQSASCRQILLNGFSSLLMYLYASFAALLHNTALMHYGSTVNVAAYAITGYLMTVYYLLAEGLASGMQPLVSYFHGAGQSALVRKVFFLAMRWVVGTGVVLVLMILIFPHIGTRIFISDEDPALDVAAIDAVRLHLFVLFLDGFLVLAAAYYQAISDSSSATMITLANMCIQIPFLLILAPWLGVTGILLALPLSTILLATGVVALSRRQFSRRVGVNR